MAARDNPDSVSHSVHNANTQRRAEASAAGGARMTERGGIVVRLWGEVKEWVRYWGEHKGLPDDEVIDAQQEAVVLLLEQGPLPGTSPGAERTDHLTGMLRHRLFEQLRNWRRRRSRREGHLDHSVDVGRLTENTPHVPQSCLWKLREEPGADPLTAAAHREFWARLEGVVRVLPPDLRRVWQAHKDNQSLRDLAVEAGVSYKTVLRRRRELEETLCAGLRDFLE